MIIEAGYDLGQLLHPVLFADDESRRGVWVLAMDENLRQLFIKKVCDELPETLELLIPNLVAALHYDFGLSSYYALAHMVPRLDDEPAPGIYEQDTVLNSAPELSSNHLLGRLVFDGEHMYSSAPRYSFRDYPMHSYLPRAAVLQGPHELLDCDCLACVQHDDMLARNRQRHQAAVETKDE